MQYIIDAYAKANKRLLLFDYDGTLVPFTLDPNEAQPSPKMRRILQKLGSDARNEVAIISGRDRPSLQLWLGDLPIGLSAEHGFWLRTAGAEWEATADTDTPWRKEAMALMKEASRVLPGSFIEEKHVSLAWHFRPCDERCALPIAKQLHKELSVLKGRFPCTILDGNKVIEIKPQGFNKGSVAQCWLQQSYDYILAVGDDVTDEELFAVLPEYAYSIKIGGQQTIARERLSQQAFLSLLEAFAAI